MTEIFHANGLSIQTFFSNIQTIISSGVRVEDYVLNPAGRFLGAAATAKAESNVGVTGPYMLNNVPGPNELQYGQYIERLRVSIGNESTGNIDLGIIAVVYIGY